MANKYRLAKHDTSDDGPAWWLRDRHNSYCSFDAEELRQLRTEIDAALASARPDEGTGDAEIDGISMCPGVRGGAPCVEGTRYPMAMVLGELARGRTVDWIGENYDGLDRVKVIDALVGLRDYVSQMRPAAPATEPAGPGVEAMGTRMHRVEMRIGAVAARVMALEAADTHRRERDAKLDEARKLSWNAIDVVRDFAGDRVTKETLYTVLCSLLRQYERVAAAPAAGEEKDCADAVK